MNHQFQYILFFFCSQVAFKSFILAESGDYCTSMAVRVAESERGQGIMAKLHEDALHLLNLKHDSIKNVMMTGLWHKGIQAHVRRSKTAQVLYKGVCSDFHEFNQRLLHGSAATIETLFSFH